jgi:phage pi2 protein 07
VAKETIQRRLGMNELPEELKDINLKQIIWDDIVAKIKEQYHKQLTDILIHPEVYKSMKINRPMNVFEKLDAGWYWFRECFWVWVMCITNPEDTGGDFFCHICSDYVKYEEDTYYL